MAKYDEEFQRNAVDHLVNTGKSLRQVAHDLGVSDGALKLWRDKYLNESGGPQQENLREENERLKKENAELRVERDILKKSVGIFSNPRK
jgi:transposase